MRNRRNSSKAVVLATARVVAETASVAAVLYCLPISAAAQQNFFPQGMAVMPANGVIQPAFSNSSSTAGAGYDVFVGKNSKGPYQLSWNEIAANSAVLIEDGRTLQPGTDYQMNEQSGVFTLTAPLASGSMLKVSFQRTPLSTALQRSAGQVPLQWNMLQNSNLSLSLHSVLQSSANGSLPQANSSLLFHGQTGIAPGSQLSASISTDLHGGAWMRRMGLQLADATQFRNGGLSLQYNRAGSLYNLGNGITAGQENYSALAHFQPLKQMYLSLQANQTTLLQAASADGSRDSAGLTSRNINGTLRLGVAHGTLQAVRSVQQLQNPGGKATTQVQDDVQLTQNLPGNTTATASYHSGQTEGAAGSTVQNSQLSINSKPDPHLQITGSFQNSLGTAAYNTDHVALQILPQPKTPDLQINVQQSLQTGTAQQSDVQANLQAPLFHGKVQFNSGIEQHNQVGTGSTTGIFALSTQPLQQLHLSGYVHLRWQQGALAPASTSLPNSYAMNMTLQPASPIQITGGFVRNPETNGIPVQALQENVGLQANLGLFSLQTSLQLQNSGNTALNSNTGMLGLSLHLTRYDTFTTDYLAHNLLLNTPAGDQTFKFGYTHNMGNDFSLSLAAAVNTYDYNGRLNPAATQYNAQAQLSLHF